MTDVVKQQSRLKDLIAKGKEQGYLTYAEVNDHLPEDISDPDQVEDIIQMINDMGIQVFEVAPDADDLLMTEGDSSADDIAAAEAAAALAEPSEAVLDQRVPFGCHRDNWPLPYWRTFCTCLDATDLFHNVLKGSRATDVCIAQRSQYPHSYPESPQEHRNNQQPPADHVIQIL